MENLSFVLWVVLVPISNEVAEYLGAKTKEIKKQNHREKGKDNDMVEIFCFTIYIVVAFLLLKR